MATVCTVSFLRSQHFNLAIVSNFLTFQDMLSMTLESDIHLFQSSIYFRINFAHRSKIFLKPFTLRAKIQT